MLLVFLPLPSFFFFFPDTAGNERYRALAPMYYRSAAAVVVVFDLAKYGSMKRAMVWFS